jgi:hypothetical protein
MIIVIGLVILVAAVVVGVAGVLSNGGSGHALVHPFAAFGYHVTGPTGTLFLYGIVTGAIAVAGLGLLLAGARRTSRRGREARRSLLQSRRETAAVSAARDDLVGQRETARANTGSTLRRGPRPRSRSGQPHGRQRPARQMAPIRPTALLLPGHGPAGRAGGHPAPGETH